MYDLQDEWLDLGESLGISKDKLIQPGSDYPADERMNNPVFVEKFLELWARSSKSGLVNLSDLAQACRDHNQSTCERLERVYELAGNDAEKGSLSKPHYNPLLVVIQFSFYAKTLVSKESQLDYWIGKTKKPERDNETLQ